MPVPAFCQYKIRKYPAFVTSSKIRMPFLAKLHEKKSELAEHLLGNEGFEGVKFTKEELMELLG